MPRAHDSQCSTRREDWTRFGLALLLVLHTGKNIFVEEYRRLTGKCPKEG